MDPQKQSHERQEHEREGKTEHPIQQGDGPPAMTSPAEPGKPGPRAPHAERGPGSAGADVGMSSDGGPGGAAGGSADKPSGSGAR